MKVISLLAGAAAALAFSVPAIAADDAAATKAMKDSGCTKCHATDKAKKGPAYQKIAAKYKGQADAEAKLSEFMIKSPKVKMDDGSEEEHKALKDAGQAKNLAQWILAQ